MKKLVILSILSATVLASTLKADLVFNEIDYDNVGTDTAEFIELYNNGTVGIDINGYSLVLFNGNSTTAAPVSYASFTLATVSTVLAPGSYFVVGNVAGANIDPTTNQDLIQNGPSDGAGLYSSGTFATGTAVTTTNLVAGIVYEGQGLFPGAFELITSDDSNTISASLQRPGNVGAFGLISPTTPGALNGTVVVPEPSTYVMLLAGVGAMALVYRRKAGMKA